jgi:hypothetical protein
MAIVAECTIFCGYDIIRYVSLRLQELEHAKGLT